MPYKTFKNRYSILSKLNKNYIILVLIVLSACGIEQQPEKFVDEKKVFSTDNHTLSDSVDLYDLTLLNPLDSFNTIHIDSIEISKTDSIGLIIGAWQLTKTSQVNETYTVNSQDIESLYSNLVLHYLPDTMHYQNQGCYIHYGKFKINYDTLVNNQNQRNFKWKILFIDNYNLVLSNEFETKESATYYYKKITGYNTLPRK